MSSQVNIFRTNLIYPKPQNTITFIALTIYAFSTLYIIPQDIFSTEEIFLIILLFVITLEFIIGTIKLKKSNLLLVVLMLLSSLFNPSLPKIADAVRLAILLILFNRSQKLKKKQIIFFYACALIGIICQLSIYRWNQDFPVLSIGDPNFSGFFTFLFFLFCFRNKLQLGIVLSIGTFFFYLSRSYLFALVVFAIFLFFEKYFPYINEKLKQVKIILIILVLNLIVLSIGNYLISNTIDINVISRDTRDLSRVVILNDGSNYNRFIINSQIVNYLTSDLNIFLFGIPEQSEEYLVKAAKLDNISHNAIFWLLAFRGLVFSLVYLLALSKLLAKFTQINNIKYIFSYFSYTLFLHAGMRGPSIILFFVILSLPEKTTFSSPLLWVKKILPPSKM